MNRIMGLVALAACISSGVTVAGAETPDPIPSVPTTPTAETVPTVTATPAPVVALTDTAVVPTQSVQNAGVPTIVTPQTIAPVVVTPGSPSVQTLSPTVDPTPTSIESIAGELTTIPEATETSTTPPVSTPTTTTLASTTEAPTTTTTTTTTTAPAGGLTIDSGAFVGSTNGTGTGTDTVHGTMSVHVTDARGGDMGWVASVTISNFVGARTGTTTPGRGRYTAPSTECSESTGPQQLSPELTPVQTARTACDARWTADIELDVPRDGVVADDYTATIVHSVA